MVKLNVEEVTKLYDSGLTLKEVGKELGTSSTTVRDFMVAHNIPRRLSYIGELDREQIKELRKEKLSVGAIAEKLGCSPSSVRTVLSKHEDVKPERNIKAVTITINYE